MATSATTTRADLDDGRYKVPHFDAKAEADELFMKYGVPTTFLRTTFYFDSISAGDGADQGRRAAS